MYADEIVLHFPNKLSLKLCLYFVLEFWDAVTDSGIVYSEEKGQYLDEHVGVNNRLFRRSLFWLFQSVFH